MRFAKRPWGWWAVLLARENFKLKLLYFKRGGQISMQRHKYRHELWLFLKGSGKPTGSTPITAGKYVHFSRYKWHQYKAYSPTLVLEIQYGTKCCEADIERI